MMQKKWINVIVVFFLMVFLLTGITAFAIDNDLNELHTVSAKESGHEEILRNAQTSENALAEESSKIYKQPLSDSVLTEELTPEVLEDSNAQLRKTRIWVLSVLWVSCIITIVISFRKPLRESN